MEMAGISQESRGLWALTVHYAMADELLAAVDPAAGHVVVLVGNPWRAWRNLMISVGDEQPRLRQVASLSYLLAVDPSELAHVGELLRDESDGSLDCWQTKALPTQASDLLDLREHPGGKARMDGLGVTLGVWLPHRGETAIVYAPSKSTVDTYANRLKR